MSTVTFLLLDGYSNTGIILDGTQGEFLFTDPVSLPPVPIQIDPIFQSILDQIDALPDTFTRLGSTYDMIQISRAAELFRWVNAVQGLTNQFSFSVAQGVWLDVWGKLYGIPRNSDETDNSYVNRISLSLTSGKATPVSILIYLKIALGVNATISEDFVHTAWNIQLGTVLSPAQFAQLVENLAFIRPAGVPAFTDGGTGGGTYLGTVNYMNAPRVTGAYLKTPVQGFTWDISAYTNNSLPLLPTTFLSDPLLNPNLS